MKSVSEPFKSVYLPPVAIFHEDLAEIFLRFAGRSGTVKVTTSKHVLEGVDDLRTYSNMLEPIMEIELEHMRIYFEGRQIRILVDADHLPEALSLSRALSRHSSPFSFITKGPWQNVLILVQVAISFFIGDYLSELFDFGASERFGGVWLGVAVSFLFFWASDFAAKRMTRNRILASRPSSSIKQLTGWFIAFLAAPVLVGFIIYYLGWN